MTKKTPATHPTKQLLIDTTVSYIKEVGATSFTVEEVLSTSGVSKGSMYHHFEDFSHLIESAQAVIFASYADEDITAIRKLVQSTTDFDSFTAGLRQLSVGIQSEARRARRLTRASILGAAGSSERLRAELADQQARVSAAIAELAEEGRNRGWVRPELDPRALALFVQAYSFGRVLDDITPDPVREANWVAVIDEVIRQVILRPTAE